MFFDDLPLVQVITVVVVEVVVVDVSNCSCVCWVYSVYIIATLGV